uniref:Putative indole-3-acetic acid-amido synthetase GH3.5 n=1 Tax=Rhizophora mucronata TaxID=61149 RepID=A0A2P2J0T6_RHIMU
MKSVVLITCKISENNFILFTYLDLSQTNRFGFHIGVPSIVSKRNEFKISNIWKHSKCSQLRGRFRIDVCCYPPF